MRFANLTGITQTRNLIIGIRNIMVTQNLYKAMICMFKPRMSSLKGDKERHKSKDKI